MLSKLIPPLLKEESPVKRPRSRRKLPTTALVGYLLFEVAMRYVSVAMTATAG